MRLPGERKWLPDTKDSFGRWTRGGFALVRWMATQAWIGSRLTVTGKCRLSYAQPLKRLQVLVLLCSRPCS